MKRDSLEKLLNWKKNEVRKPLLIRGARQVGKTWLVREHAKNYENFVEINLEAQPELLDIFRDHFGFPHELVKLLSLVLGKEISASNTLLFIDEIQESKEALLSLRYFKEKFPELHVISAGSLLEFTFEELNFPVGRIDFFYLFPLSFFEFLDAIGWKNYVDEIKTSFLKSEIHSFIHKKINDLFFQYSLCGGMPEAVKTYVETGDFNQVQSILQMLATSFREDFYKYSSKTNIEYLRLIFDNVPRLLGSKFKYSQIDRQIKSRDLSQALNRLEKAGLVYKAFHSSCQGLPLGAQIKLNKFKVFFLDIGLCHRMMGLQLSDFYLNKKNILSDQGGLSEQIVAQELLSQTPQNQNPELFYWHREAKSSQAEVDLVIQSQENIIPIEVKTTKGNQLKSLRLFLKDKSKFVKKGYRISSMNFKSMDEIDNIPFYMSSLLV